ncbi:All-trans-nonaprenyl-diphosphate synthase (geranyl-diphosphate specific) [Roseimaritima multifibrata]|uniref:All-trans-nonaprenyl-diphosphate synthase (Geranyl-diphosphate specific) n=1 Tax=Roseimaritima multifibrata TaxID=1930274 RepID=A0A517MDU1_9BACT|nr:polyprenyl synthetase family protein [Roseimaritima multifibrata]QDS93054.1 All-trans-nonaprenyl-diphosphate synthase (geranyl-diphosphate specific) [Roseimaritima multifibrata]
MVPETLTEREALRQRCNEVAAKLDKAVPLNKDQMEQVARRTLEDAGLPEGYLGWAMVMLSSAFWKDAVAATEPSRRLFLLPHCLKHAEGCPADYDQFGMDCKRCGACSIADFRSEAEAQGYRVLVAEGSPVVMKIIVSGYVDAIVGVACLNVLEKAIDKILLAGIPCMAVPLLSSDCRNTSVDEPWVADMIRTEYRPAVAKTRSYVHLMRAAADLFTPDTLTRIVPPQRSKDPIVIPDGDSPLAGIDPIAATEAIAYDFLSRGGKHSRPFITLAAYDALSGDRCTGPEGAEATTEISDSVRRAAMSIESFHKASLVHDDIQDDDSFRYGQPALHHRHGLATAINVGDYLIGMGYRLVSREAASLGADTAADLLDNLAAAHMRLSEGQGAELIWRDSLDKRLKPIDALKVYALKTSPAFEAALYSGIRMAGDATEYVDAIRTFSRNMGVAFQILNDLGDWNGDSDNKLIAGGDVLGGRPTILWALALEALDPAGQEELLATVAKDSTLSAGERIATVRRLYRSSGAFDAAARLVDKHQARAEQVADGLESEPLRRLFYFLVDTVLERPSEPTTPDIPLTNISTLGTV